MDNGLWYLRHESGREITILSMENEKLIEMMPLGYIEISLDGYHYIPIEEYLEPQNYQTNEIYTLKRNILFRPETFKLLQKIKSMHSNYNYHELIDIAINELDKKEVL